MSPHRSPGGDLSLTFRFRYTGPQLGIEASGQYTSRLESHLYATSTSNGDNRHDDHNNDEEEDDDDGLSMHQMMISGSVAREAMID